MPFVATAGYADCLDPAVANHGLQYFRFTSDEQGQAFRGLVPNIWWDSVVGLPGQDRPVMLFSDAQLFAYSVVREIKGAAPALVWLVSPLTSGACEKLLLWALNAVERTACSFGGALGRMAEKAKAHDNADDALSLDDTSYLVLPADLPGAGNDAAMWLQELTVGTVAAQDGGPRALGWLEWHRTGVRQVRQPAIETLRTCASRLGRLDNVLPHPGTAGDRQEWCEAIATSLAANVVQEPCCSLYRTAGHGRASIAREEVHHAGKQIDGTSTFMRDRVSAIVEGKAALSDTAVLSAALRPLSGVACSARETLDLVAAYGGVLLPAAWTDPGRLFTPHGISQLAYALEVYRTFLLMEEVAKLRPEGRARALATRVREGTGNGLDVSAGAGAGMPPPSRSDGGLAGVKQLILSTKEQGSNPAIFSEAIEMAEQPGFDALKLIQLLLCGLSVAAPNRKPTGLTQQVAFGIMPGHAIDPRLAPVTAIWAEHGGRYIARWIGKKLAELGFALEEQCRGMRFDPLAKAVVSKDIPPDLVNDLVIAAIEHIHTSHAPGSLKMQRVAASGRYTDLMLNLKLPHLAECFYQCLGRHFTGPHSVRSIIDDSNAFMPFNVGITAASSAYITTAQHDLIGGSVLEEHSGFAPTLDVRNPAAKIPTVQLRGSKDEGTRGEWQRKVVLAQKASLDRQTRALNESLDGAVGTPSAVGYVLMRAAGATGAKPAVKPGADAKVQPGADAKEVAAAAAKEKEKKRKAAEASQEEEEARKRLRASAGTYSHADARFGFKNNGKTFFCGKTEWDAEKAATDLAALVPGQSVCLTHLFLNSLSGDHPNGCDDADDSDHQGSSPAAHVCPPGFKPSSYRIRHHGGDASPSGGRAGGKGGGKGKGKSGGKGKHRN